MRRASKRLHEFDDRQTEASWKRTLGKALATESPDAKPYVFDDDTAAVLERFFDKPAGYFVRPQHRRTVREERDELRQLVERYRQRYGPIPE